MTNNELVNSLLDKVEHLEKTLKDAKADSKRYMTEKSLIKNMTILPWKIPNLRKLNVKNVVKISTIFLSSKLTL